MSDQPTTPESEAIMSAAKQLYNMATTQPKPTGEWTVEHGKLHDTIIAGDERIEFPLAFWQTDKIVALHDAERERADACELQSNNRGRDVIRYGHEIQQLREQLAAEREKVRGLHDACRAEANHGSQLREQLAAEREKVQPLGDVLIKVLELMPDWTMKDLKDEIKTALAKVGK